MTAITEVDELMETLQTMDETMEEQVATWKGELADMAKPDAGSNEASLLRFRANQLRIARMQLEKVKATLQTIIDTE